MYVDIWIFSRYLRVINFNWDNFNEYSLEYIQALGHLPWRFISVSEIEHFLEIDKALETK